MAYIQPGYGRQKKVVKNSGNVIFALIALMGVSLLFSTLAFFITRVSLVK